MRSTKQYPGFISTCVQQGGGLFANGGKNEQSVVADDRRVGMKISELHEADE